MGKNTKKYLNHKIWEIEEYLKEVKLRVNKGNFDVPTTSKREENRKFIEKYRLNMKKRNEKK